jgi:hypothetical protein
MMVDIDPNHTGEFACESLTQLILNRPPETDTIDDVLEALKVFIQDGGDQLKVSDFK